jgi:hypothetical protein
MAHSILPHDVKDQTPDCPHLTPLLNPSRVTFPDHPLIPDIKLAMMEEEHGIAGIAAVTDPYNRNWHRFLPDMPWRRPKTKLPDHSDDDIEMRQSITHLNLRLTPSDTVTDRNSRVLSSWLSALHGADCCF